MSELPYLLVVDASKVVRASLAKSLRGHFAIREETCGESAWQALILDPKIIAVIAGAALARLDSAALLDKVRSSRLCRIKVLPFFLIESDALAAEAQRQLVARGVSGFLPKGLGALPTARRVKQLLAQWGWSHPLACSALCGTAESCAQALYAEAREDGYWRDDLGRGDVSGPAAERSGVPLASAASGSTLPDASPDEATLAAHLADWRARAGARRGGGVLYFALDRHRGLLDQFGPGLVGRIEAKFERLLDSKLGKADRIVRLAADRFAVFAADATRVRCVNFAERVVQGVTAAQVSIGGRRLRITVSAGVACLPDDAADDAALPVLAGERLEAAMRAGGNRVLGPSSGPATSGWGGGEWPPLGEWLKMMPPEALLPQLGRLGLLVMPILQEVDRAYGLGLPLADIERRLQEKAPAEMSLVETGAVGVELAGQTVAAGEAAST